MIDASDFSIQQIRFLSKSEQHIFLKLDFTCCDDAFICAAIGNALADCIFVPMKYRRSSKLVREFFRLSKEARRQLEKNDGSNATRDTPLLENRCLGLVRSLMGVGTNVTWGNEEEEGYDSLVRSSIRKKAQLLKENTFEEHGLHQSGQIKYVLRQLYSSQIQKRTKDAQQYARYVFTSERCSAPLFGELICNSCNDIKKGLRRLCKLRYEQDNKILHKKTKISTIINASPSKTLQKIDMVVDNLRSVQKVNCYLKSRLEEQRLKDGINVETSKCEELFDESAEVEAKKVIDSMGEHSDGTSRLKQHWMLKPKEKCRSATILLCYVLQL